MCNEGLPIAGPAHSCDSALAELPGLSVYCTGTSTEICAFVWEAVPGYCQIGHHQGVSLSEVNAWPCTRPCGNLRQIGLRPWRALLNSRLLMQVPRTPKTPAKAAAPPTHYESGGQMWPIPACSLDSHHCSQLGHGRISVKNAFAGATVFITGAAPSLLQSLTHAALVKSQRCSLDSHHCSQLGHDSISLKTAFAGATVLVTGAPSFLLLQLLEYGRQCCDTTAAVDGKEAH